MSRSKVHFLTVVSADNTVRINYDATGENVHEAAERLTAQVRTALQRGRNFKPSEARALKAGFTVVDTSVEDLQARLEFERGMVAIMVGMKQQVDATCARFAR